MHADVPVRHELLWQLAAVLKAQQPLWLAAGAGSEGPELHSRLVSAQHELLALLASSKQSEPAFLGNFLRLMWQPVSLLPSLKIPANLDDINLIPSSRHA